MKSTPHPAAPVPGAPVDHLRFHRAHEHLTPTFGSDRFAMRAEAFARFFGTPMFLGAQTVIVLLWIVINVSGLVHFDLYPFILLNLAFSLQAAYAAPLILLAQTRQAERDKARTEADAKHREALAVIAAQDAKDMLTLLHQNTELTAVTNALAARIETLTVELHRHVLQLDSVAGVSQPALLANHTAARASEG
ncbi:DUF1003 domain-containing protein [Rugamonas sp. CCM 8940]|uniref:DUF1003 domain-containing protein n=1 Tax=Rugamonas sp. CCM 8940 TaxID=2765359 RepID=UPI0018F6DB20|nr:DUF1003 domain-containing protein [Rugamonas sp. CCM 8940]MBJ7313693.1 DUF1003 domain-containing protein [Rugamonas sp. CCM 8940]